MIIVSSISPNHANSDNQMLAIDSWQRFGKCYSLNTKNEISKLEDIYNDIEFVETNKTVSGLIGKGLISINELIDFAIYKKEGLLLINSDIILADLPELKNDGITIFSRYDYKDTISNAELFIHGFDVFHIPYQFLEIFPPTIYALGMPFFDYSIPMRAFSLNIPVYYPKDKYAFHKLHETQYNDNEWHYIGEFFKWEFKFSKNLSIPEITTQSLQTIKSKLISY
jgi:hypothetical protein